MAGRPESQLDPGQGPVQRLASELRALREAAGSPTYREMAARTGCGASTLSQAAGGDRLPSLPVVLAYVEACGADADGWEQRWRRTADEETRLVPVGSRGERDVPPYRGLERFESENRELFFGREEIVGRLAGEVRAHRLVALVGASGSGKSSLLRAGLVPLLQSAPASELKLAALRILLPGPRPATTHEKLLVPNDQRPGDTVIIVDQFEELYTLCTDPHERAAFLNPLLAGTGSDGRLRVVISVRADFFGRCAEHHELAAALREATLVLGPMGPAELRKAVTGPARAAGFLVEKELTARIVAEAADEPGSLPLVSHALLETWRRRRGRTLTEAMYEAAGGIRGAIAATAEDLYTKLTPIQAETARRVMLRLITPGDGTQDTRRPAPREELETGDPEANTVLERLLKARLLTLEDDTVDIAHEALITAWPRYHAWIDEDRERLRVHRRLTEAARAWAELDRDPGALYRGTRLAAADDTFAPDRRRELTPVESNFLTASLTARSHETQAASRAARRLRALITTLSVLLVLAVTAGLFAWQQQRAAVVAQRTDLSRQLAALSSSLMDTDPDTGSLMAVLAYRSHPTDEAIDSLYTAAAEPLRRRYATGDDGKSFSQDGRVIVLSPFAPDTSDPITTGGTSGPGARSGNSTVLWWDKAAARYRSRSIHTGRVQNALLSDDGRVLATEDGKERVQVWDTVTCRLRATFAPSVEGQLEMTLSPDGHTVATSDDLSGDRTLRLWDAATGRPLATLAHRTAHGFVEFSPDGRTLATGENESGDDEPDSDELKLWDTATGRLRARIPASDQVRDEEFSPDGRLLAFGIGATVRIYDAATGRLRETLASHTGDVMTLAFSPNGQALATGDDDSTARLWDVGTGRLRHTLTGHTAAVEAVAFSQDGRTLATGGDDTTARLWDVGTGRPRTTLTGHTGAIGFVEFGPDERTLISADDDTVRLWDATTDRPRAVLPGDASPPPADNTITPSGGPLLAFGANGRALATVSATGSVRWFDTATGRARTLITGHALPDTTTAVAFGGDGRDLTTDRSGGKVTTWTSGHARSTAGIPTPSPGSAAAGRPTGNPTAGPVGSLLTVAPMYYGSPVLSPDGHTFATISQEPGALTLWDGATCRSSTVSIGNGGGNSVAVFSPAGHVLAVSEQGNNGAKGWVSVRSTADGHVMHTVNTQDTPLAFSPDERTLATVQGHTDQYGSTVQIWDVAADRLLTSLSTADATPLTAVAFSPDNRTLATTNSDGVVRLWDVATHYLRATLQTGSTSLTAVAFSPDGRTLATVDNQGAAQLWNVPLPDPGQAIDKICRTIRRDLTAQQRTQYGIAPSSPPACPANGG